MTPRVALAALVLVAGLGAVAGCTRTPGSKDRAAWSAEIARLRTEQDSLRVRAAELVAKDAGIARLPKGDIVVVVPTAFLHDVITRVFDDVVDNVTLTLSGIKAHVAKTVKKIVKVGEFTLDVEVHKVIGRLEPGQPDIRFGGNRVAMSLPIAIRKGQGEATLHFVWDGKNVADLTCGDMDITQRVAGNVVPAEYVVTGSMDVSVQGNSIRCTPKFPETRMRIRVEPTKEAWGVIDSILAEKQGVCGWVLDKVNVPKLLEGIVQEKGINVKLPVDKLKPFTLPAGVRDTVTVGERVIVFNTRTNTLRVDPDAVWYSADVALKPR